MLTAKDVIAPVLIPAASQNVNLNASCSVTIPDVRGTATDNCTGTIITQIPSIGSVVSSSHNGTINVLVTATDGAGLTDVKTVVLTAKDVTAPTIVCPVNITLSACQSIATWSTPVVNDNCAVTIAQTAGPVSGSTFAPNTVTTITYTATDAAGNTKSCSFIVTRAATLSATIVTNKPTLYFGYAGDQTATITATPFGGTAPYTIKITMVNGITPGVAPAAVRVDGKMIYDFINSAGDELWNPGANTNSVLSTGITSATNTVAASSTSIPINGSYSVNVTLLADARFIATVIDANGCSYVTSYELAAKVDAEDVRCFAGNSGNAKVTICHRTGSTKNPCVTICVDESAVQEHLNHGDFLGKCTPDCIAPKSNAKLVQLDKTIIEPIIFNVKAYPNPTDHQFTLVVEGDSNENVEVIVYDMLARMVKRIEKSNGQSILFGEDLPSGEYLVLIKQGINQKVVNLIKQ
ncbi:HYR domain-containing protein [Flavobacterium sp. AED]|uniref:HYR domain-containing protein n=1 Tax=Flavobacterium sp. AED TaxID=1423323 RepID=UPI0005803D6E|nr:HYR domain-containing protein [Flavobacterium sp. AED]KIA83958.1 hypothetical protein OA85_14395 [Flavobacterium sp. AED]